MTRVIRSDSMLSRRDFVKTRVSGASLFAMAPAVPGFLAATARIAAPTRGGRVLVVVQLDGGNDGIDTVVPYKDEGYARSRKALRLDTGKLLKVNDTAGLHPRLGGAAGLLERGALAIVQGVGYPNPSRSHFRSMAIWHTARRDPEEHRGPGWPGRAFDERLAAGDASGTTFVGAGQPPAALIGRRSVPATLDRLEDLALKGEPGARRTIGEAPAGDDLSAFVRRTALDATRTWKRRASRTASWSSASASAGGDWPRTARAGRTTAPRAPFSSSGSMSGPVSWVRRRASLTSRTAT
jgi:uncharacterized protein (DUF1501 family)